MRMLAAIATVVLASSLAPAEETLLEISWATWAEEGKLEAGTPLPPDDHTPFARLRVETVSAEAPTATVLTIDRPPIKASTYAVVGQVRCEDVEGKGYLELWSHFADSGKHYSRTLAGRGPMKHLSGTSGWRRFVLPFRARAASSPPQKLVVNVVLPGGGAVELGDVRLVQYAPGEDPLAVPGQWWGERTGGLVGGLLGAAIGCLGALIGVLGGSGKARGLVLGALKALCAFGIVLLALGLAALALEQPYAVYYPLLLLGGLCAVLPPCLLPGLRKRYEALELRRMEAQDMA